MKLTNEKKEEVMFMIGIIIVIIFLAWFIFGWR